MNNCVQTAHDTSTRTAPSGGVTSGVPVIIANEFLIPVADAAEGDKFAGARTGTYELTKKAGAAEVWAEGEKLFWDNGNSRLTKVSAAGLFPVGTAAAAAADPDTTGVVRLDGVTVTAV